MKHFFYFSQFFWQWGYIPSTIKNGHCCICLHDNLTCLSFNGNHYAFRLRSDFFLHSIVFDRVWNPWNYYSWKSWRNFILLQTKKKSVYSFLTGMQSIMGPNTIRKAINKKAFPCSAFWEIPPINLLIMKKRTKVSNVATWIYAFEIWTERKAVLFLAHVLFGIKTLGQTTRSFGALLLPALKQNGPSISR